jgi:hypothetical protein
MDDWPPAGVPVPRPAEFCASPNQNALEWIDVAAYGVVVGLLTLILVVAMRIEDRMMTIEKRLEPSAITTAP